MDRSLGKICYWADLPSTVTQTLSTGGCREQRKKQIFPFGGPVLEHRSQTGSQGKSREGFCGFPACPAEFGGLGELGSAWLLCYPPALLSPISREITCQKQSSAGGTGSLLWAAPAAPRGLDFSLCLALQQGLQALSAAPGLTEGI